MVDVDAVDLVLVGSLLPGVENHSLSLLRRAAEDAGQRVTLLPLPSITELEPVCDEILRRAPRLCGISLQSTETALVSLMLARLLRQRGYAGRIVCGGHFATLNARDILESPAGVDYVVRFSGQPALLALLVGMQDDDSLRTVPGLVFRAADGSIRNGAAGVPLDPRQLLDHDRELPRHLGFPAADLVLSHGCEARCGYCCVAALSDLERREREPSTRTPNYARADVSAIARQIADLQQERGARLFNFMDDNLLPLEPALALAWLTELEAELARRRVGTIALSLQLRADVVSPEVADALVRVGLVRAYVGIDGTSPGQLRALGRRSHADAGAIALERLSARGVFAVCNALLIGPTFAFETVQAEIDGLARLERAPVHLLPLDVRAGTALYRRAQSRNLLEGSFLWRHYRFEDRRTELLGRLLLSLPTRLEERSVPVALYDLGYNLGAFRRLRREAAARSDRLCALYDDVARAWNADQIRVLRAGAEVAASGDEAAMEELIRYERPRVQAHDSELLWRCDGALEDLEELAKSAGAGHVLVHARGKLLAAALSFGLAACGGRTDEEGRGVGGSGASVGNTGGNGGLGGAASGAGGGGGINVAGSGGINVAGSAGLTGGSTGVDAGAGCPEPSMGTIHTEGGVTMPGVGAAICPDGSMSRAAPYAFENCASFCDSGVQLAFDVQGRLVEVSGGLPADVRDCLSAFIGDSCYPSFACSIQTLRGHCWVA